MLIYLLRHGLTAYNAEKRYQGQRDIPLSPAGRAQLRQADLRGGALPGCKARGGERPAGDVLRQL